MRRFCLGEISRFDGLSSSARPSSSMPLLCKGTSFVDVVLKRFSRSVVMEEDTLGYGGGDSGIEMIKDEVVFSHFVLTREPDLVCQSVIE